MSLHSIRVTWSLGSKPFTYAEYGREHAIFFGSSQVPLRASAAPEYRGDASLPNPEEQLVSALSTCHMLTFLAIAANKQIVIEAYEDEATGTLAKNAEGRLAVTTCVLRPRVTFASEVDRATLDQLHVHAHRGCFIAQSMKTAITVEPRV